MVAVRVSFCSEDKEFSFYSFWVNRQFFSSCFKQEVLITLYINKRSMLHNCCLLSDLRVCQIVLHLIGTQENCSEERFQQKRKGAKNLEVTLCLLDGIVGLPDMGN